MFADWTEFRLWTTTPPTGIQGCVLFELFWDSSVCTGRLLVGGSTGTGMIQKNNVQTCVHMTGMHGK